MSEFGRRARITVRTLRFYEEIELLIIMQQHLLCQLVYLNYVMINLFSEFVPAILLVPPQSDSHYC
ncbi:MerR family transcriptional regulator [Cytobacillus praedii]|uniref:MerR family transcriptional regulator n=1 Tax=Cytobacillus praedii TaxID=1742358 RepID=UPI003F7F465A